MKDEIATRYREFEIPGTAQVVEGNGGLPKVRITTPDVIGEIYLHGAHITSWKPHGEEEVLFLSSQSRWEDGHAIRGGIPICFPWFWRQGRRSQSAGARLRPYEVEASRI